MLRSTSRYFRGSGVARLQATHRPNPLSHPPHSVYSATASSSPRAYSGVATLHHPPLSVYSAKASSSPRACSGVATLHHPPQLTAPHTPHVLVLLGASGDLARKKIYPAIWALYQQGMLPKAIFIVGYARDQTNMQQLQQTFERNCHVSDDQRDRFKEFMSRCSYVVGSCDSADDTDKLNSQILEIEASLGKVANRLYYLAIPPEYFEPAVTHLRKSCMARGTAWTRVIIEKPFGYDDASSAKLSSHLAASFHEDQIYRIDHYLGKGMVQSLPILRFGNHIIASSWNRDHISGVAISLDEDFGTQGRGGYFDKSGIIRDVMQNHLMQIFTLLAMEKPATLNTEDMRNEKVKLLMAVRPVEMKDVVLGQYIANPNGKSDDERTGYRDDPTVPYNSNTATFASAVLWVHNERWDGVPFFLRCGKALNARKAEVCVQYREVAGDTLRGLVLSRDELTLRIQPDEAIRMKLNMKRPGFEADATELHLTMADRYKGARLPDAYERLLLDAFSGNQNNFVRTAELEEAWRIFTPLLKQVDEKSIQPDHYVFGSRGPESSDRLMMEHGFIPSNSYKQPSPGEDTPSSQQPSPGEDTPSSQQPSPGEDTPSSQQPSPGEDTPSSQQPTSSMDSQELASEFASLTLRQLTAQLKDLEALLQQVSVIKLAALSLPPAHSTNPHLEETQEERQNGQKAHPPRGKRSWWKVVWGCAPIVLASLWTYRNEIGITALIMAATFPHLKDLNQERFIELLQLVVEMQELDSRDDGEGFLIFLQRIYRGLQLDEMVGKLEKSDNCQSSTSPSSVPATPLSDTTPSGTGSCDFKS